MNKKIISTIELLCNEKSLEKETVYEILEKSLEISIKKKIKKFNIKVVFNRKLGTFSIFKLLKVVKNVLNFDKEILFNKSFIKNPDIKLGEYIREEINEFKFNRIISKTAKQIILNEIKEIEKRYLIKNFKNLIGNIFTGLIKKIFNNKIILDIGYEFEAILNNKYILFNENYIIGKKIKVILYDVKYNLYGLQLLVSRTHIEILYKLITNKIYEFKKNIFKIIKLIRNPGIKTKIIIKSKLNDVNTYNIYKKINKKLIEISNSLNKEEIEIILWNNDLKKFIKNVIYPIKLKNIILNEKNITIFIKKKDLYNLLGKNNNNIKMIYKIFDKSININTL